MLVTRPMGRPAGSVAGGLLCETRIGEEVDEAYDMGKPLSIMPFCRQTQRPIENASFTKPVRLSTGIAGTVVAISAQRLPIRRNPCVDGSCERVDSWNMIQPRNPAPVSKAACDLIGRVRANVDDVVGGN